MPDNDTYKNFNILAPDQIAEQTVENGYKKANTRVSRLFVLGILAGPSLRLPRKARMPQYTTSPGRVSVKLWQEQYLQQGL